MPEQGIDLMMVVVGTIVLLAVIIGLVFLGVIGPIDSTKKGRNMEFACTQYQGEIGCARSECTTAYDSTACRILLANTKYGANSISVWETCNSIGINDPKNCHIRCCGKTG
ncbi:MAG: hypothetical protein V1836_03665 [Candidatus Aenigmatarchaeota archaeon]